MVTKTDEAAFNIYISWVFFKVFFYIVFTSNKRKRLNYVQYIKVKTISRNNVCTCISFVFNL